MLCRTILLLGLCAANAFAQQPLTKVAVFEGDGVGVSSSKLIAAIESERPPRFEVSRISADDILGGKLNEIQVLIQPGGSGSKQGKALGAEGRELVRKFVAGGGGYLGVCGGAYLATNDYTWSLNLIDAKVVDRKHWNRGTGPVKVQLSPAGSQLFNHEGDELEIFYGQGPLLGRPEWDDEAVPDYESLAIYGSEIAKKGAPSGVMIGTSAAVRCEFGNGRVFCFSPHPELTDGLHHLIPVTLQWLAPEKRKLNGTSSQP